MKRNGKVEIFESSLVHVSNKLLKSKRARVFFTDVVDVTCSVADASSSTLKSASSGDAHALDRRRLHVAATSSGTMRSASVGGASAVPPPLGSLRNMSSLLHEVRSRAGVVGKFVLRLTLRQGAVVTTVVTIGLAARHQSRGRRLCALGVRFTGVDEGGCGAARASAP
jgi:hypothetical protein